MCISGLRRGSIKLNVTGRLVLAAAEAPDLGPDADMSMSMSMSCLSIDWRSSREVGERFVIAST